MSNRVTAMIVKYRGQIESRLKEGVIIPAQVEALRASLDMPLDEYASFQTLKSLAVASGKLTPEEGQAIYQALGETPGVFNGQDIATKSVLTKIYSELLSWQIANRPSRKDATQRRRRVET